MSSSIHHDVSEDKSMQSYVIGFILSLIFTLIPYYLVVNQIVSGLTLLITILSFALVQLVVQVTFFLHIGRGPQPNWNLYFLLGTIGIILIVVGGSIVIINNLHGNLASSDQTKRLINGEGIYQVGGELTGACQGRNTNHRVRLVNDTLDPKFTIAARCDTLTFLNDEGKEIEITFGRHDDHVPYAGLSEIILKEGRSKTITLSETGTYEFHNHLKPKEVGSFAVFETK